MNSQENSFLFWLDLEMTGLEPETDVILEVGAIITDLHLKPQASYEAIVFQPPEQLKKMNTFCQTLHTQSGLIHGIPMGKPLATVEEELLTLLDRYFPPSEKIVLCGNSIWNDRLFVQRHLKKLKSRLHYRLIDISSLKELFRRKYHLQFSKKNTHRALEDIQESILELSYYLQFFSLPALTISGKAST